MSASPSGQSNSGTPVANGEKPKFIRKPKPADPLRQHKSRPLKGALSSRQLPKPSSAAPRPNGLKPTGSSPSLYASGPGRVGANGINPPKVSSGFSSTPEGAFQDFPLYTTKKALREGLRYHVSRFASRKHVDPTDQDEFPRPVSLHRRDPRQPPPGKAVKDEDPATGLPLDSKEQEKLELARLEKEAQRAADLAQIAPTGNNASALAAKKSAAFRNEKTTQVHRLDKTEEQKKESDLRYEEALPWHLEDAENKHTWVGNYEAALSDTNVILVIDGNSFKMIPLEKWYKFAPKNQFKTLTIEEAEAQLSKKSKASRWVMHTQERQKGEREQQEMRQAMSGLYKVKGESITFKRSAKAEVQDADDIDFEGDLFEDDDEQPTVEPDRDEETKETADKIKREQLGANLFGEADEYEVDKEQEKEEKDAEVKKKLGKRTKKALQKREKNFLYESDSSNPYGSDSSDDEESDDEKRKEEDAKKEEEAKLKAKSTSKIPSGASSKGTNTPLGRPKQSENQKRPNHLKRPGSPDLSASEMSGNESSRKKHKKKHVSSSQPTGTSTPVPSRPMSPAPSASQPAAGTHIRRSSIVNVKVDPSKLSKILASPPHPSTATSDGEGTAGEMSDGAEPRKKKPSIKMRIGGGTSLSPSGSRAASPASGSRAGSPAAGGGSQAQGRQTPDSTSAPSGSSSAKPVTAEEIIAALPPTGISIGDMLKLFPGRVKGGKERDRFIRMVKENSSYNADDKKLRPKA